MKLTHYFIIILTMLLFSGCASGYKNLEPSKINYISSDKNNEVTFSYKYDVLNKKYSKKEIKKDLRLIAVKVTNASGKEITIGDDCTLIFDNGEQAKLMENNEIFAFLKQSPASYLWYLLLTPMQFYTAKTNNNGYTEQTSSFPVGVIIGPGLAAGNFFTASAANKKLKNDLSILNLLGRKINQGETVYGLLGIRSTNYNALHIKLK
ncbi:hypothetical protein [Flavobacterium sp. TSSA_36]|jgi:hypothetical protein|uniref:hypothetical protein n=1 Tax=Flavobacterium sp. TSSA_36 TaxID=3447669 RepID=UPI003F2E1A19